MGRGGRCPPYEAGFKESMHQVPAVKLNRAPMVFGADGNQGLADPVHAHALELLYRHDTHPPPGAVHLDIGYGGKTDFAERLSSTLGLAYVAACTDPAASSGLAASGFETHDLLAGGEEAIYQALRTMLAGRTLVSISFLDVLHTLDCGADALRAIARLASGAPALVVVSVPNAADSRIAAPLMLGKLAESEGRRLSEARSLSFTGNSLRHALRAAGLHSLDRNDTTHRVNDQHAPQDHPFLARGTEIGGLLRSLREQADPQHADVADLVWLCAPGPADATHTARSAVARRPGPFLTVVMRTQARRPHTLREALLCLHGQTDRDMEILVVGHCLTQQGLALVERIINDQPVEMRALCRLIRVEEGGRTRLLNVGFAEARGRYIAILDDDDIPFAHWVETFRLLHSQAPGRVLRAACVRQDVRNVTVQGHVGLRGESAPLRIYAAEFDMIEHLRTNLSPSVTLAFPRGVFHDLSMRFDETLNMMEDWDFLMRTALLVGVAGSAEATSIYRWWELDQPPRSLHQQEEWDRSYRTIVARLDTLPLLLPPGSVTRLSRLLDAEDEMRARVAAEAAASLEIANLRRELGGLHDAIEKSLALRFARMMPGVVRKVARPAARLAWRVAGGRFWLARLRRR